MSLANDFDFKGNPMRGGSRSGAGRPRLHETTENCLQLDVRRMERDRLLIPGMVYGWQWMRGDIQAATIDISIRRNELQVSYRYRRSGGELHDVDQRVGLLYTPCHYGGTRRWFACPTCSRRVAIIYIYGWPACRRCKCLVYASQSENRIYRAWGRTHKIEHRLSGGSGTWNFCKPKGMHLSTFERLTRRWLQQQKIRNDALKEVVMRNYLP